MCKKINYRNIKSLKSYVPIFFCFSIRPIHLELFLHLSTLTFSAAQKGFDACRGTLIELVSECVTNFIGAIKKFHELYNSKYFINNDQSLQNYVSNEG